MRFDLGVLALAIGALACGPARAANLGDELEMCDAGSACRVASATQLDALRGGFTLDTGRGPLRVGIGITRSVSVNDRVVAVSHITIPDLGAAISRRHGQLAPDLNVLQNGGAILVQNGPGNVAPSLASLGATAMPTIVQNTIDNQKLATLTIVDAWVNSLSVMRALRTSEMLQRATAASGR